MTNSKGIAWVCIWALLATSACREDCKDGCGGAGDSDSVTSLDSEPDGTDPGEERFEAFEEALKEDLAESAAFGVSAAIMEDGEIVYAAAFGFKDPDGVEPLTPDTLMQIGSTTKQMTATALLQKVAEGHVSVENTLDEVLPDFEFERNGGWDDEITVHHLLSQQSGIVDWTPWGGSADDGALRRYTYDRFDDEQYVMSPPGAFFNYANPNYVLTGLIAETLDTRAFPDILREDVFLPLGMERTFVRKAEVVADGDYSLSFGYADNTAEDDEMFAVPMSEVKDSAWIRPIGLVWTTPSQMMTWAEFIMKGDTDVLSDALRAEMTSRHVDTFPGTDFSYYGYGIFVDRGLLMAGGEWIETPVLQHGGNTLSFTHLFYILPEYDFAVAICSNAYSDDFDHSLRTAVTTLPDLPSPERRPGQEIDPERFNRHEGHYVDPWRVGDIVVTRDGDELLVEMPTLTNAGHTVEDELKPITSDIFWLVIDGEPYEVMFIPETEGARSTYLRHRSMVAVRAEQEARGLNRTVSPADVHSLDTLPLLPYPPMLHPIAGQGVIRPDR